MSAIGDKADISRTVANVCFWQILLQKTVEGFLGQ